MDTQTHDPLSRLKAGVQWMWSLGDYGEIAARLAPGAVALADAIGIRPGMRVLDVAAGNGNFAVTAALRGAIVTASDLTPQMVALGRARSEAVGVTVAWQGADAEALPFETGAFDVVASVFGAMFAPRPARVAAELFRVARPGGVVAMANYAPDGFLARFADLLARYAPSAPTPLPSPFAWGDLDEVRRRFDGLAAVIAMEPRVLTFAFATPEEALAFWERTNGPLIALRHMVPAEMYDAVRAEAMHLFAALNQANDDRLVLTSGYLQVLARKHV